MIDFREVAEAAARLRRVVTSEDYGDIYPQDCDPTEGDDRMLLSEAWLEDFPGDQSGRPMGVEEAAFRDAVEAEMCRNSDSPKTAGLYQCDIPAVAATVRYTPGGSTRGPDVVANCDVMRVGDGVEIDFKAGRTTRVVVRFRLSHLVKAAGVTARDLPRDEV